MMKVVIDTNVIISALNFDGKPKKILQLANEGAFKIFISPFILEEISNVLIKKFLWSNERVEEAIILIKEITSLVQPTIRLSLIKEKDSDNRILECAIAAKAHFLISGDTKHILPLKKINEIIILKPADFLSIIFPHET